MRRPDLAHSQPLRPMSGSPTAHSRITTITETRGIPAIAKNAEKAIKAGDATGTTEKETVITNIPPAVTMIVTTEMDTTGTITNETVGMNATMAITGIRTETPGAAGMAVTEEIPVDNRIRTSGAKPGPDNIPRRPESKHGRRRVQRRLPHGRVAQKGRFPSRFAHEIDPKS